MFLRIREQVVVKLRFFEYWNSLLGYSNGFCYKFDEKLFGLVQRNDGIFVYHAEVFVKRYRYSR